MAGPAGSRLDRVSNLVYGRAMPGRKRPTTEDTVTARRVLLDGLARDAHIDELAGELAPLHPRNDTFPGEVFPGSTPCTRRSPTFAPQPAERASRSNRYAGTWTSALATGHHNAGYYSS